MAFMSIEPLNSEALTQPNKTKSQKILLDLYLYLDELFLSINLKIKNLSLLFLYLIGYKMAY